MYMYIQQHDSTIMVENQALLYKRNYAVHKTYTAVVYRQAAYQSRQQEMTRSSSSQLFLYDMRPWGSLGRLRLRDGENDAPRAFLEPQSYPAVRPAPFPPP